MSDLRTTIIYAQDIRRGDLVEMGEDMPVEILNTRPSRGLIHLTWGDQAGEWLMVSHFTRFELCGHVDLLPTNLGAVE